MAYIRLKRITIILLLCFTGSAHAFCDDTGSFLDKACQHVTDPWTRGRNDLYLPLHVHHFRFAYTREQIDSYREDSWGIGYGRSHYDETGNLDSLYGMTFLDSHSKLQYVAGYAHQWMWGQQHGWHTGLGYTAFFTARANIDNYLPFPGLLPMASVNYDQVSINATYIPGSRGNGNVVFIWSRFGF